MLFLYYCLIALLSFALFEGTREIFRYWTRFQIIRKKGCKPPPSLSQAHFIFGLDLLFQFLRSVKENRVNLSLQSQFERYGSTFQSKLYGTTKFFCIEPQNIQTVLMKDARSWGLQPIRLFALEPFAGKGIMNTDGVFWEHSRALIRPIFARAQIAELHLVAFHRHVNRFLDLIPRDGSTVDLQPLLARLGLDSSTEFLFGESVDSLLPEASKPGARAFLAAFNYAQMGAGKRLQMPQWNFLTRDKRFWDSCKIARDFVDGY
ncbi:MAG: hypothetical protein Q9187_008746, partial [Circinaria calcarea]